MFEQAFVLVPLADLAPDLLPDGGYDAGAAAEAEGSCSRTVGGPVILVESSAGRAGRSFAKAIDDLDDFDVLEMRGRGRLRTPPTMSTSS